MLLGFLSVVGLYGASCTVTLRFVLLLMVVLHRLSAQVCILASAPLLCFCVHVGCAVCLWFPAGCADVALADFLAIVFRRLCRHSVR